MLMRGIDANDFIPTLIALVFSCGAQGAAFVYIGSSIVPSNQKIVTYLLTVLIVLIAGFLAFPAVIQSEWLAIVGYIATSLGAGMVAYKVSEKEIEFSIPITNTDNLITNDNISDEQKTSSIQAVAYKVSEKEIKSIISITNTDNLITNDNISDEQKTSSIQTVDRFIENLILVEYWFYIIRKDDLAVTAHKNVIKRAIKRLIEQKEIPTAIYSDLINRSRFYELIVISQAMISLDYPSPIEKLTWTKLNYSEFTLIENITDNDVNKYLQGFVRRYTLLEDFKIPYLDLDMLEW
jgi:hypothetical protein